jgi:hypothetical protein
MFRTRDFILVFLTVGFLVLAIIYTLATQNQSRFDAIRPTQQTPINEVTAVVVESDSPQLNRDERLRTLREKIAASELIGISAAANPETQNPEVDVSQTSSSPSQFDEPLLCPNYQVNQMVFGWPATDIITDTREGSRVYYTVEMSTATSTASTSSPVASESILLQLPIQFVPLGTASCLASDVVGVALDGSLIKNQEASLYQLFTNDSLIGYALDGFPIYGTGSAVTDNCGGRIVQGQYRYELSESRDNVLNCFSGNPQILR